MNIPHCKMFHVIPWACVERGIQAFSPRQFLHVPETRLDVRSKNDIRTDARRTKSINVRPPRDIV